MKTINIESLAGRCAPGSDFVLGFALLFSKVREAEQTFQTTRKSLNDGPNQRCILSPVVDKNFLGFIHLEAV